VLWRIKAALFVRRTDWGRLTERETNSIHRRSSSLRIYVSVKGALPVKKLLTLDAAKKIATAAEAEAKKRGATVVIVVVDDGGHLLLLERLDDT
jgi:hypothetical protein